MQTEKAYVGSSKKRYYGILKIHATITGNFEDFQFFNIETNFWKTSTTAVDPQRLKVEVAD